MLLISLEFTAIDGREGPFRAGWPQGAPALCLKLNGSGPEDGDAWRTRQDAQDSILNST